MVPAAIRARPPLRFGNSGTSSENSVRAFLDRLLPIFRARFIDDARSIPRTREAPLSTYRRGGPRSIVPWTVARRPKVGPVGPRRGLSRGGAAWRWCKLGDRAAFSARDANLPSSLVANWIW